MTKVNKLTGCSAYTHATSKGNVVPYNRQVPTV